MAKKRKGKSTSVLEEGESSTAQPLVFRVTALDSLESALSIRPHSLRLLLHPEAMEQLGLCLGSFVWLKRTAAAPGVDPTDQLTDSLGNLKIVDQAVTHGQRTPAIVWPSARVANKTAGLASRLLFENLGATLDEETLELDVSAIDPLSVKGMANVEEVTLIFSKPALKTPSAGWELAAVSECLYRYRLLAVDMRVNFSVGITSYECTVGGITPASAEGETAKDGYFKTTRQQKVRFNATRPPQKASKVAKTLEFDVSNVGGLKKEIELLREMVVMPLVNPDAFLKMGLPLPKGVLLYGPPGTGKTMLAKAVAKEADADLVVLDGGQIISKYFGETETRLRQIWTDARKRKRCVLFIDEIDSLCPSRSADGVGELERRIVATFLTLMDGSDTKAKEASRDNGMVVLAATNRLHAIDEALRRPGRFDREIEIGVPSASDRLSIIEKLLRPVKHVLSAEEIRSIADRSHGYVGADLVQLVREAGLAALRESQDHLQQSHFELALAHIQPSAMREVSLDVAKVRWSDIGGQETIKSRLKEAIEWPLKHASAFKKFNVDPPKGLLLYGPPGCSKTMLAKALATECGLNFLAIQGPELFNKYVGESERGVREIFRRARQAAPSILFFDEIDAIAVKRSGTESSVNDRMLTQLLTEMDGVECLNNVTIVAATNRPDILDAALLRPGRIDRMLYVGPPDFSARKQIFAKRLSKMHVVKEGVTPETLAEKTDGFSGAECVAVCQDAAMRAMEMDFDASCITMKHFEMAISTVTPRISAETKRFYENFRKGASVKSI